LLIIETSVFTKQIQHELDDESYRLLQAELVRNPEAGAIIRGTGGLRKIRWARMGHGKSGGARVIYYWHKPRDSLLMLLAYSKSGQEDLTPRRRKALRLLVEEELK
jgi:mRNA-degrading endonuclease RelE of RelBE toxin-antitoxin system